MRLSRYQIFYTQLICQRPAKILLALLQLKNDSHQRVVELPLHPLCNTFEFFFVRFRKWQSIYQLAMRPAHPTRENKKVLAETVVVISMALKIYLQIRGYRPTKIVAESDNNKYVARQ